MEDTTPVDEERLEFHLKDVMDERGIKSFAEVERITGVRLRAQSELVKRRKKLPHPRTLVALCDGLECEAGDLIKVRAKETE